MPQIHSPWMTPEPFYNEIEDSVDHEPDFFEIDASKIRFNFKGTGQNTSIQIDGYTIQQIQFYKDYYMYGIRFNEIELESNVLFTI